MLARWMYLFLLLWTFTKASLDGKENVEIQKKKTDSPFLLTMAPNSKFLNPHVDDATNLQFAMAAFDDVNTPGDNKRKASETLSKRLDSWSFNVSSRGPKSLNERRIIPFLNMLFNGVDKNFKFKKI